LMSYELDYLNKIMSIIEKPIVIESKSYFNFPTLYSYLKQKLVNPILKVVGFGSAHSGSMNHKKHKIGDDVNVLNTNNKQQKKGHHKKTKLKKYK
jgi:hypothetical protein